MKKIIRLLYICLIFATFYLLLLIVLNKTKIKHGIQQYLSAFTLVDPTTTKFDELCAIYRSKEAFDIDTQRFYYYSPKHHEKYLQLNQNFQQQKNDAIQSKSGLLWCNPQKVASTTLARFFLSLIGENVINLEDENITTENDTIVTLLHDQQRITYGALSLNQIEMLARATARENSDLEAHVVKLMLVRDPFERILSAYRDKLESFERDLEFRDGYYYNLYGKLMVQNPDHLKPPTWHEFISYLIKTKPSNYDEHWMPISRLCLPCTIKYDYIIKLENFHAQINAPLQKIGILDQDLKSLSSSHAHRTGSGNLNTVKKYFSKLTLEELKELYKIYEADFQLFGYSPLKYFEFSKGYGDDGR